MIDPLTGVAIFSITGNVVQFVGLGFKAINKAYEIAKSSKDTPELNSDLDVIVTDLRIVTRNLKELEPKFNASTGNSTSSFSADDYYSLNILVQKCQKLSVDLFRLLDNQKITSAGKRRNALSIAWRSVLDERKVRSFRERLDDVRSQIMLRLLSMTSQLTIELARSAEKRDERLMQEVVKRLDDLHLKVSENKDIDVVQAGIQSVIKACQLSPDDESFLRSLCFNTISSRDHDIHQACPGTYDWLVQSAPSEENENDMSRDTIDDLTLEEQEARKNLLRWLESGTGIFWISGKAGAGKSTLMKKLVGHEGVEKCLKAWAGQDSIYTCKHFFWAPGTKSQKSELGLMQTLLVEILVRNPELVHPVALELKSSSYQMSVWSKEWGLPQIRVAFNRLMDLTIASKFCFFIDGLDEFSSRVGHMDIVKTIKDLSQRSNVKLCVSSRESGPFPAVFGQDKERTIRLQNVTKRDISLYVKTTLKEDPRFLELIQMDEERVKERMQEVDEGWTEDFVVSNFYEDLIQQLLRQADGVFLWVFLAVNSLLRGITNSDTPQELRSRLSNFPSDLDTWFGQILDSTEREYQSEGAEILLLLCSCDDPSFNMELLTLSFWDRTDEDFGSNLTFRCLADEEVQERCLNMAKRLVVRCGDLVEVVEESVWFLKRIKLVHRTAHDYLTQDHIRTELKRRCRPDFDLRYTIVQLGIVSLKLFDRDAIISKTLVDKLLTELSHNSKDRPIEVPMEWLKLLESTWHEFCCCQEDYDPDFFASYDLSILKYFECYSAPEQELIEPEFIFAALATYARQENYVDYWIVSHLGSPRWHEVLGSLMICWLGTCHPPECFHEFSRREQWLRIIADSKCVVTSGNWARLFHVMWTIGPDDDDLGRRSRLLDIMLSTDVDVDVQCDTRWAAGWVLDENPNYKQPKGTLNLEECLISKFEYEGGSDEQITMLRRKFLDYRTRKADELLYSEPTETI